MNYRLTSNTKEVNGHTLYQIQAVDHPNLAKDTLGGWIESEANLAQEGDCWLAINTYVYDDARVSEYAFVSGNACVCGNACISDNACVSGNAFVSEYAFVSGNAFVSESACVYGNAHVCGNAFVSGNARVCGNARISDNACVSGNAFVSGNARISDNARVSGDAFVSGKVVVGTACVDKSAILVEKTDLFTVSHIGSRNGYTTVYRTKEGANVVCGCFNGTLKEFEKAVIKTHENNQHAQEYLTVIALAKIRFGS